MENQVKPQPGDLVWANRMAKGRPYNHCGIYEGAGYVIHFAAPDGSEICAENAVVHRTTFERFSDDCPVKVVNIENSFPADKTLQRARSCIGMKGYNFATFNCDHFATWCKTGEYRSLQVDEVKNVLKAIGNEIGGSAGSLADLICEIHDIAETLEAPRLKTIKPKHEKEILGAIETNADLGQTIPPVPDAENDIQADYEILDEEPIVEDESGEEDDDNSGDMPSSKKAWYEKVCEKLKDLSYPISGALELLKQRGVLPPVLQKINYTQLGAKVRNVIDCIDTTIKTFTGRLPLLQAVDILKNNEVALAGKTIAEKQIEPVKETLKQVFGKTGSVIKHIVQQTVTKISSPPVREAITSGAKLLGNAIVTGIKTAGSMLKTGIKIFGSLFKQKLFS